MAKITENITSLFLPTINILQDKSLDIKLNFELDFQNNELYVLQELTRCSSLINYIHHKGRNIFNTNVKSKVNSVFDTFMTIRDPLGVFIDNFEQFFAMYIHSKYGKNNFKLYMKECEKSPVAYPISVFEDSMCIFMQYNTAELRNYIYNIMTMFYYYTGQNFYEMICPNLDRIARPNNIDEYTDVDSKFNSDKCKSSKRKLETSREEKLCFLNRRNLNVNKPLIQQTQSYNDNLSIGRQFKNCLLTGGSLTDGIQYTDVLVGGSKQQPIVGINTSQSIEENTIPISKCNRKSQAQDMKVFNLSDHLKRSCNFELRTIYDDIRSSSSLSSYNIDQNQQQQYNRKAYVQTNFSKIWTCVNRRQLVSLTIIYSVMNVCIQKITYSLIESRNRQSYRSCQSQNNYKNINTMDDCEKIFKCINDPNTIDYEYNDNDEYNDSKRKESDIFSIGSYRLKTKRVTKLKKPTIEITFNRENHNRTHALNGINSSSNNTNSSGSKSSYYPSVDNLQFN